MPARTPLLGKQVVCSATSHFRPGLLVFVFAGNIVLGDFVRSDFRFVGVRRVLDAAHRLGLEGLPFFFQLFHAF
jgi:hypothetical protein